MRRAAKAMLVGNGVQSQNIGTQSQNNVATSTLSTAEDTP
jgi:hypothetical protein